MGQRQLGHRFANTCTDTAGDGSALDAESPLGLPRPPDLGRGAFACRLTESPLVDAGLRLQTVASDLEDLLFGQESVGHPCCAEIHSAIGLVMDALQALGHAQKCLTESARTGESCPLVHPQQPRPLGRA